MSDVTSVWFKFIILAGMLLGLPQLGVALVGFPVGKYLQFPPKTQYVIHTPFSWFAFTLFAGMILAVVLPVVILGIRTFKKTPGNTAGTVSLSFPWWGWFGVASGLVSWALAWTRFPWFAEFQPHTFSPLWFSYIVVINALCFRRTGHSIMTDNPGFFILLFPLSASFWWFFEYLNRFVQNWYYVGVEFGPWEYFWYATLPFSTVLPAVLSTQKWFLSMNWIRRGFSHCKSISVPRPRLLAVFSLIVSAAGLTAIGIWPNYLFPLLWVSPVLIIISLQALLKEHHILSEIADGDWSGAVAAALAAIFCGWFWEMWNYFSLAKWKYNIPLVDRFSVFEMPLLGYAGYLPFGLECMVIGIMIERILNQRLNRHCCSKLK
ncbi:MAG: hypothetical protein PVH56_08245 [Desulfobacterales bacterium]